MPRVSPRTAARRACARSRVITEGDVELGGHAAGSAMSTPRRELAVQLDTTSRVAWRTLQVPPQQEVGGRELPDAHDDHLFCVPGTGTQNSQPWHPAPAATPRMSAPTTSMPATTPR